MKLPKPRMLTAAKRQLITTFYGLDRTDRCVEDASDGESYFSDMENGGSDSFPFAASRAGRAVEKSLAAPCNGLCGTDKLAYVDGTKLIYDGREVLTDLINGEKQIVPFGAYLLVFPDAVYYNTVTGESGEMDDGAAQSGFVRENSFPDVRFYDGETEKTITDYSSIKSYISVEYSGDLSNDRVILEPSKMFSDCVETLEIGSFASNYIVLGKKDGMLYYLYSADFTNADENWSAKNCVWKEISVIDVEIGTKLPSPFTDADIGNLWYGSIKVNIEKRGTHYYITNKRFLSVMDIYENGGFKYMITGWRRRNVPVMDYVTACDNRLFGCRMGAQVNADAGTNVLYASALGDFKAWEQFQGISTDSWYAHCGESGPFTGACTYNGHPMFFKEDCAYILSGSYPPYSYTVLNIDGVALGASRSLCEVDGALYYKSRNAVMRYTSSSLGSVSDRLGRLPDAVKAAAGGYSGKYYLSLEGTVYVYDAKRGIWCKEDACGAVDFAVCGGELYIASSKADEIGSYPIFRLDGATPTESDAAWSLTTPIIGYGLPNRKYVSKVLVRMELGGDELPKVELSRDGGAWEVLTCSAYRNAAAERTGSMTIPIRPRRCETFRIRLSGTGAFKLTGITKLIEEGGR